MPLCRIVSFVSRVPRHAGKVDLKQYGRRDNERVNIKSHTTLMTHLKRKRRPIDEGPVADMPPRVRSRYETTATEPSVSVSTLQSANDPSASSHAFTDTAVSRLQSGLNTVERLIVEQNMLDNKEQSTAVQIIGRHVVSNSTEQLLMYVSGVGGTGKSHVINTVVKLFERLGRRRDLLLSAPTGIAAVLIKGYTIHALTFLPKSKFHSVSVEELQNIWRDMRYLIINETSMVSATLLAQISQRLTIAKGMDQSSGGAMFGGVNVLFCGDQGQLKPVRQKATFSYDLVDNIRISRAQTGWGQEELYGAYLWRQVKTVVELKKNIPQQADQEYAELLNRIRCGGAAKERDRDTLTSGNLPLMSRSDYSTLLSHELLTIKRTHPEEVRLFEDAPIIVGRKALRDAVNRKKVHNFAKATHQQVHDYCSRDRHSMVEFVGEDRKRVWNILSTKTSDSLGRIPMVLGMPVMLTENIAIGNKVVNGSDGILTGLRYEEDDEGNRCVII
jgi:hypothetical protein